MCELGPFPLLLPGLALALALDPDITDCSILDPYITKYSLHLASDTSVLFPLLPLCTAQAFYQHLPS